MLLNDMAELVNSADNHGRLTGILNLYLEAGLLTEEQRFAILAIADRNMAWSERNYGHIYAWFNGDELTTTEETLPTPPPTPPTAPTAPTAPTPSTTEASTGAFRL